MRRRVVVTDDARGDLEAIYDHIAETASPGQADRTADRLLALAAKLAEFPDRGSHPRALAELGHLEFRQVILKPWLLIYGVEERDVVIYVIADSRRDMRSLLAQRLLGA
ncbi:MAG: type II toxin-antitoxin system RelE/ParE family toxin [Luteimonas sp.]